MRKDPAVPYGRRIALAAVLSVLFIVAAWPSFEWGIGASVVLWLLVALGLWMDRGNE